MGTLLLVATYILVKYPLYYLAAYLSERNAWCARQAVKLYPGRLVLDFCMLGYIQVCFAVTVNLYALEWTNDVILNNIVMFAFAVGVVVFPVWLTVFMIRNYDHLQQNKFKRAYLPAYQNIDLQNNRRALAQPIIYIARRLAIVLVSVLLADYIFVQIFTLIYMQLAVMSYNTQVQPFVTRQKFRNEMFNEITGLIVIYHLLTFTEFVVNPETRLEMGWSLNTFMIGNLLINIRLLAMMIFKDIMSTVRNSLVAYRMSQRRKRMTPKERAIEDDIVNEKNHGHNFSKSD